VRVPTVVRWPGHVDPGTDIEEITSTLDFLPTAVALAGATLPSDRSYDGVDLSALLAGEVSALAGPGVDGRREQLYYRGNNVAGIRSGRWKLLKPGFWRHETNLYDLETDPGERFDRAAEHPDLVKRLSNRMDEIPRSW
jgi:arylsulfatase A-like enzyme